jgi:hypothetical protein
LKAETGSCCINKNGRTENATEVREKVEYFFLTGKLTRDSYDDLTTQVNTLLPQTNEGNEGSLFLLK